jgi:hypothetical protein
MVAISDNLELVQMDTISSLVNWKCGHKMEEGTVWCLVCNSSFWSMIYYTTFHRKNISISP